MDKLRTLQRSYKTSPGLSDLKQLQVFNLVVIGDCEVSDIGGYMGLALAGPHIWYMGVALHKEAFTPWGVKPPPPVERISEPCRARIKSELGPYARLHFTSF